MRLRFPNLVDVPAISAILEDHQNSYLDDYKVFNRDTIVPMLPISLVIADNTDYPIGVAWIENKVDDLHLKLLIIVRPKYLRAAYRSGFLESIINWAFSQKIGKIKAAPRVTQKGAIKALKSVGFRGLTPLYKETRVNKVKTDILPMELRQGHWQKKQVKDK